MSTEERRHDKQMSIMPVTVSKGFSKHLMEKSGLLRYAAVKGKTRIEIEYDADTGKGWMNVFGEDFKYDPFSQATKGGAIQ